MANKKLLELPNITTVSTGSSLYMVEGGQSYQGPLDKLANVLIPQYGILTSAITTSFMSTGNAQIILNGLNDAPSALLNSDKINFSGNNFFFEIDGGTYYDTYVNTSTFDGGSF